MAQCIEVWYNALQYEQYNEQDEVKERQNKIKTVYNESARNITGHQKKKKTPDGNVKRARNGLKREYHKSTKKTKQFRTSKI